MFVETVSTSPGGTFSAATQIITGKSEGIGSLIHTLSSGLTDEESSELSITLAFAFALLSPSREIADCMLSGPIEDSTGCVCRTVWWRCTASGHVCTCRAVVVEGWVQLFSITDCKSGDLHECVCNAKILPPPCSPDSDARGVMNCRSITGHNCCCDAVGPALCKANRHCECVCSPHGVEKCKVEDRHECCCDSSPGCRATTTDHYCICPDVSCRSQYGNHICICRTRQEEEQSTTKRKAECRSRLHY